MPIEFVLCDVFAERPFAGNPLAVLFGADAIDDDERLALAREFGWSEITFVAPPERAGGAPRVDIWTPTGRLPFAGHPTIGTTVVCVRRGLLPASGPATLELGIGPTPVEVIELDERGGIARMTGRRPEFGVVVEDRPALAAALGLDRSDLLPELPVQTASVGSAFLIVPLRSLDALRRLRPDPAALPDLLRAAGARRPYAFTLETLDPGATVHAQMRDVDREDPATGSAAGALGAYLVEHRAVPPGRIEIEQGHAMERPSRLTVEVAGYPGDLQPVRIAGRVVVWAEGRLSGT